MAGISEEAVNEVARNLFDGGDIDYTIERDGSANIDTWNLPDVDNYEYSYGTVAKETLDKAIELLTKLISSVKFYVGDNGASLELNDNHTLWDINAPDEYKGEFDYDYYQYLVDQALDDFEERTGVEAHQDGRMGRHIVVDITFDNMTRFDELKAIQEELEADVIKRAEDECFPVAEDMTESLNKGEKKARCLSCGADVIYTNRDIEHDIDGDYIECPNCHATFDVDYDAIEPLLNKKTESYEVWQKYFEDGEIARPEYVQSFDTFEKAQKFADGLNEDPNCEAWVKDLKESKKVTEAEDTEYSINNIGKVNKETGKIEVNNNGWDNILGINNYDDLWKILDMVNSINLRLGNKFFEFIINLEAKNYMAEEAAELSRDWLVKHKLIINLDKSNKVTEAEDMTQVKDYVKSAVEKSDSTKQEKDQVKGSIDVLKTDEESAIDGYEEFNKETSKVVDKELADTIDDQMQEIVDDEKEHIEKLDTIKSALGESKKEELFNNSINLNVDAGDIASGNNLDLGGLGALAGLMASEETKNSDDKLEEATSGDVIRENLNTGVLRIIDVDMYSINDEIPESATQEGLDEIVQDIAPKYIKEVIQEVLPSVEIYATGVYHPKQYNFSGDELEFDLVANKEEYEALKEKVTSNENFNAFLRNNYKSYDGFISYMADDISEFETQDTWKQVVQVIMFAIQDEDNFGAIRNEYLDEFLDRVHTEFGWDDEEDDELDENKKEELFNNTLDVNVNANDISSNNTLDLGGLGDLMGMTEAKALEAKNNLPKTEDEWVEIEAKRQWKDNQEAEFGKWENQSTKVKNDYKKEIANNTQNERQEYFENKEVNN